MCRVSGLSENTSAGMKSNPVVTASSPWQLASLIGWRQHSLNPAQGEGCQEMALAGMSHLVTMAVGICFRV